ncbi:MAG TPA: hypothetical protein VM884_05765, partial [Flavisolibacter sp.]|nr:hypothetical protein [Flavisolibacter sp.]
MQKVYLLLRNNQQTGPFGLEEIIKFDLKPYDLIWIEGKSAGWYYPQEIKALHPYLSFVRQPPQLEAEKKRPTAPGSSEIKPRKVFVAMPAAPTREEAVQEPSLPASTASPSHKAAEGPLRHSEPELKTTYAKSIDEVETEYMNWAYQTKTKKRPVVSKKGAIAACLLVSVAFGAWQTVKSLSGSNNTPNTQMAVTPVLNEIVSDSISETSSVQSTVAPSTKTPKQPKPVVTKNSPIVKQEAPNKPRIPAVVHDNPAVNNDYETAIPAKDESKVATEEKSPEPI